MPLTGELNRLVKTYNALRYDVSMGRCRAGYTKVFLTPAKHRVYCAVATARMNTSCYARSCTNR